MKLRGKTLLIFGVTLAALLAFVLFFSRMVILRSFGLLEEEETRQQVERAMSAYSEDLSSLDRTAKDWASWDNLYKYMAERDEMDPSSEFANQTLANVRVNFVSIIDSNNRTVFDKAINLQVGAAAPIPSSFAQLGLRLADQVARGKLPVVGPVILPQGVLMVSARPILTSEDKGPAHGVFIGGRLLDAAELSRLAEISHQSLQLTRLNEGAVLPADVQIARGQLTEQVPNLVRALSAESIAGYRLVKGMDGRPAFILRIECPRRIYGQGQQTLIKFAVLFLLAGVIFAALTVFLLETTVLSRIATLSGEVRAVRTTGDLATPVEVSGRDEITDLATVIDGTFKTLKSTQDALCEEIKERRQAQEELERVHRELMLASRRAGMAEIATNVLHNVGNVLNSVNVSAVLVSDLARKSPATDLKRVVELMREHEGDIGIFISSHPQGKHIPAYLAALAENLRSEQARIIKELGLLRSNIDHIKEIVSMQQNYARLGGANEIVSAVELVQDSLRINEGALERHGVRVIRDFEDAPLINVDKHKVLQILVNLVRNAKYACAESGGLDRRVRVGVKCFGDTVRITVADNGVGIPTENLTRIFSYGFTTRKNGHGFGLHSGARAARELSGSLSAHSDGPGHGAVFTLTLPLHSSEAAAESEAVGA